MRTRCSIRRKTARLSALAFVFALTACQEQPTTTPSEGAAAISGETIDRLLQLEFEDMELPLPAWTAFERFDDDQRLVVHVRIPDAPDEERAERYRERCLAAKSKVTSELSPGQRFELYLVFDSTVRACR